MKNDKTATGDSGRASRPPACVGFRRCIHPLGPCLVVDSCIMDHLVHPLDDVSKTVGLGFQ